jgi:hypothetical protein
LIAASKNALTTTNRDQPRLAEINRLFDRDLLFILEPRRILNEGGSAVNAELSGIIMEINDLREFGRASNIFVFFALFAIKSSRFYFFKGVIRRN